NEIGFGRDLTQNAVPPVDPVPNRISAQPPPIHSNRISGGLVRQALPHQPERLLHVGGVSRGTLALLNRPDLWNAVERIRACLPLLQRDGESVVIGSVLVAPLLGTVPSQC